MTHSPFSCSAARLCPALGMIGVGLFNVLLFKPCAIGIGDCWKLGPFVRPPGDGPMSDELL